MWWKRNKTVGSNASIVCGEALLAPRRGRPTPTQSAAIERAIRDAAAEAFLSLGYEGTSMEGVASRAGVPKSTLYKRYPEKRALLRAVLSERVARWCEIELQPDDSADLQDRLERRSAALLRHAISPEVQAFWSLVTTAWNGPEDAGIRQEVIGYAHMVESFEREISSGADVDPSKAATALMAMLCGWIEYVGPTVGDRETAAKEFAASAVQILMQGMAAW
jgi:AcrR family transcriptional regulator